MKSVSRFAVLLGVALGGFLPNISSAQQEVLDLFLGRWRVDVTLLQPQSAKLSYTERYRRVLDGNYIQGETDRKPDGSRDIVFGTYDSQADGFPFWIFSSTGSYSYLAPGTWDARQRQMHWKNPTGFDISYESVCEFPGRDSRRCYLIIKDWKGKVMNEMSWTATRISD